jgi:type IV pilus assembly protein PilV
MKRSNSLRCRRLQAGMSMIEIMVAVLVLSVGLLGMASLMGVSLRNTQSANFRTQAANIAYEATDIGRAFVADGINSRAQGFLTRATFSSPTCNPAAAPTYNCDNGASALTCDFARIVDRVCRTLPDGRIRTQLAAVPGGVASQMQLTVDICWNDDRSEAAAQTPGCTAPSETMFRLVTEL